MWWLQYEGAVFPLLPFTNYTVVEAQVLLISLTRAVFCTSVPSLIVLFAPVTCQMILSEKRPTV